MAENAPCPKCAQQMGVKDSRPGMLPGVIVRRRRVCVGCGFRCTTHELLIDDAAASDNASADVLAVLLHDEIRDNVIRALRVIIAEVDPKVAAAIRKSFSRRDGAEQSP